MFAYVSCPHYLAEIVIYLGLALVTGGSVNTLLMLAWVVSGWRLFGRGVDEGGLGVLSSWP